MTLDTMLLAGAGVLLAALGAARLSSSVGLPSLLLFLFLGVGVGLWVEFDDAALAHDLGFAALVLILGEGGFTTKWREMRPILSLAGLLALGLELDEERNLSPNRGARRISTDTSPVSVLVIPTNEELAIARACVDVCKVV